MRRRGGPPNPRGVHSFEELLPGAIVSAALDTSFVVEALLASQPLHVPCASYLTRLAEEGVELVFGRLLELELREAAFQVALKERHPRDWKRFRGDGRARRRADRLMNEVLTAWDAVLESFVWTKVEIADVIDQVGPLTAMGLASYDAAHAATAIAHPVDALVTVDAGFAAVAQAELTLHVDSSRVRSCRARRARSEGGHR